MMVFGNRGSHPFASFVVQASGVGYFLLWSYSFWPQFIMNFKRRSTVGVAPDFLYLNPLGFLCLLVWSYGAYFSPTARQQYSERHNGSMPEVSGADVAFATHAFLISSAILLQMFVFRQRDPRRDQPSREGSPLLGGESPIEKEQPSIRPSLPCSVALVVLISTAMISAILVWLGKLQFLDWLYVLSTIKLVITFIKYPPQVYLNWQRKSTAGFALAQFTSDLGGAILSLIQLVVSSVFINHDPHGIIANPVKLGLSFFSMSFDIIFVIQALVLYPKSQKGTATQVENEI